MTHQKIDFGEEGDVRGRGKHSVSIKSPKPPVLKVSPYKHVWTESKIVSNKNNTKTLYPDYS